MLSLRAWKNGERRTLPVLSGILLCACAKALCAGVGHNGLDGGMAIGNRGTVRFNDSETTPKSIWQTLPAAVERQIINVDEKYAYSEPFGVPELSYSPDGKVCIRGIDNYVEEIKLRYKELEKNEKSSEGHGGPSPVSVTRFVYSEPLLAIFAAFKISPDDAKSIVDWPTISSLQTFKDNLFKFFADHKDCITKDAILQFINSNFKTGADSMEITEVEPEEIKDIIPLVKKVATDKMEIISRFKVLDYLKPIVSDDINIDHYSGEMKNIYKSIINMWSSLIRKRNTDCSTTGDGGKCVTTQLETGGFKFVVPGGRFREVYLWDSLTIIWALIDSGYDSVAHDMLELFSNWIHKYTFIPNGGRTYYLMRSQPPLFPMMVLYYINSLKVSDSGALYRRYKTYLEFLPAIIYEKRKYWDKYQLSVVPGCKEKLRDMLGNIIKKHHTFFPYSSGKRNFYNRVFKNGPCKTAECIISGYEDELVEDIIPGKAISIADLTCSGYHYGSYTPSLSDFNDRDKLLEKLSKTYPRIESYVHDIETTRLFAESFSTLSDDLVVSKYKSDKGILRKLMHMILATYAESGWDFSSRWVSDKYSRPFIEGGDNKSSMVYITDYKNYVDDENSIDMNDTLKNIELRRIYPIDLNSIMLRNMNILEYFLSDFIRLSERFSNPADIANVEKLGFFGSKSIADELHKIKVQKAALKNFISIMLWDSEDKRFCDHVEGLGCKESRSAAEFFPYWLQLDLGSSNTIRKLEKYIIGDTCVKQEDILKAYGDQYDFFLLNIGCLDYFHSFLNTVDLLSAPPKDETQVGIPRLIIPTKFQTNLQWDAPYSWAPLEYAAVYSHPSLVHTRFSSCSALYDITDSSTSRCWNSDYHRSKLSRKLDKSNHRTPLRSLANTLFHGPDALSRSKFDPHVTVPDEKKLAYKVLGHKPRAKLPDLKNPTDPLYRQMVLRMFTYVNFVRSSTSKSKPTNQHGSSVFATDSMYRFFEKYNTHTMSKGGGGEYDIQEGFGWTNAVLQKFITSLVDTTTVVSDLMVNAQDYPHGVKY